VSRTHLYTTYFKTCIDLCVCVARRVLGKGDYSPLLSLPLTSTLMSRREASYYNLKVGDTDVVDAAWYVLLLDRRIGILLTPHSDAQVLPRS
jgi:hypothetical protein